MLLLWILTLMYGLAGFLINDYFSVHIYLTVSFIGISSILLLFVLLKNYYKFAVLIFLSFTVRVGLMLVDLYAGDLFTVPHSGDDTENFYATGLKVANDMTMLGESIYGGTYSHLLGILFSVYGDDRLFAQYLNILIAVTAIVIVIQIFRMLKVPLKIQIILAAVMAFFPHSLIFSAILLRESIISLIVVCSLYFFIKWYKFKGNHNISFSIILVVVGGMFHTGVIGILIGYIFALIFYRHDSGKLKLTLKSVLPFALLAAGGLYLLMFPEIFSTLPLFNKFEQELSNNKNIYDVFNTERGESAYLTNLEINNFLEMIIFAPLKILYFIGSPMPWTLRNLSDLISFFLDSVFYLFAAFVFIKNWYLLKKNPLLLIILISLVSGWLIFGLGISNAGTALRHRFKLFYLIIIALGLIWSKNKRQD